MTNPVIPHAAGGRNNFDHLRIFAALLVLVSHSYPLAGSSYEPFFHYFGYDTGGGYGVTIFFVISGYLVTRSAQVHDGWTYVLSRALRIWPALAVLTLFEILVIAPLAGSSVSASLGHLQNLTVFNLQITTPNAFITNPIPAVNGSLWTLPIESSFYVVLPLLAALGLLRPTPFLVAAGAFVAFYVFASMQLGIKYENQGEFVFSNTRLFPALKFGTLFMAGSAMWLFRDRIPLSGGLAICCLILMAIGRNGVLQGLIYHTVLPYLIIYAALALPALPSLGRKGTDLSYGTYLYAFPIQQAVVWFGGAGTSPTTVTLVALPITLALAALSWHFVEQPALKLRHRLQRRNDDAAGRPRLEGRAGSQPGPA